MSLQPIYDDRDELKWEECPEFLTKSLGCSKSVTRGQSRNRYWSSFESDKPFKDVSSPLHTKSFSSTGHVSMMSSLRFRVSITALFRDLERARLSHSREGHCPTHTSDKTDAIRKPISLWHQGQSMVKWTRKVVHPSVVIRCSFTLRVVGSILYKMSFQVHGALQWVWTKYNKIIVSHWCYEDTHMK